MKDGANVNHEWTLEELISVFDVRLVWGRESRIWPDLRLSPHGLSWIPSDAPGSASAGAGRVCCAGGHRWRSD